MNPTNAAKAIGLAVLNAGIQFIEAFGIYDFTDKQQAALVGLVNVAAMVYVALTYKQSPKRIPE